MDDLIERLRAVKWEVTDDCSRMPDDPTHKCVFVDMRPEDFRALLREAAAALESARETLRDVTGVAICGLFDTHREDTLREFSLQELARVTEVTAPLLEEGVTVESVYRRGYDAAIDAHLRESDKRAVADG